MSSEERETFFSDFIVTLRAKDKEEKARLSTQLKKAKQAKSNLVKLDETGKWYFYNMHTVAFGVEELRHFGEIEF